MKLHRTLLSAILLTCLCLPPGGLEAKTINAETEKTTLAGTEEIPLNDSGADKKATIATVWKSMILTGGFTGTGSSAWDLSASSGTFLFPSGAASTTGTITQTSAAAAAFASGLAGNTNPVFRLVNNIATQATGLSITGRAAAAGVDLTVLSSGTDEGLKIEAKGAGTVLVNNTATGAFLVADATNPAFSVVHTTEGTGWKITSAAAASGVALAAISSGTDESATIDAKGAGTLTLNGTATGNLVLGANTTSAKTFIQTSASSAAFASGLAGNSNPVFRLVNNVSSQATGLSITGRAAAAGVDLTVLSSGTDEPMNVEAKGAGMILMNATGTGPVQVGDATNPSFKVVHTSEGTGLSVTSAAAASGVAVAAISSGTNENMTLDAKGSGTLTLNGTATGNLVLGANTTSAKTLIQTSAAGAAFSSGLNGDTNPVFRLVNNISSQATGVSITGRAAAAGVDLTVLSSGTDETLRIEAKGAGTVLVNETATGAFLVADPTNPAFKVVHTSEGTGLSVTSATAASGVAVAAISSGTDENMTINAKGAGSITLNGTATGNTIVKQAQVSRKVTTITGDGAVTLASGIVVLTKGSAAAITVAAPSSQDGTEITIESNSDFAHVITFTGATLLDGTTGANTTVTFTAFKGSAITFFASGTTWLLESQNNVTSIVP